jgi:hypothetical protein
MNTSAHPVRHSCTRKWLRAAAGFLFTFFSGCQSTPRPEPWELASFTGEHRLKFFRAELARVAPELDRPDFFIPASSYRSDPRSQLLFRSGEYTATLVEEDAYRTRDKRIPYVSIHGKPTGRKGEMEIFVATGYGQMRPLPQISSQSGGAVIGASVGASTGPAGLQGAVSSGTACMWASLSEQPYRRRIISLH